VLSNIKYINKFNYFKGIGIKISDRFAALENLGDSKDINRTWQNIKENIKISAKESLGLYELKQHKPWFDECLQLLDQRKHAIMQLLQDPNQSNVDNLNNVSL
jgi:hypothetical protein